MKGLVYIKLDYFREDGGVRTYPQPSREHSGHTYFFQGDGIYDSLMYL